MDQPLWRETLTEEFCSFANSFTRSCNRSELFDPLSYFKTVWSLTSDLRRAAVSWGMRNPPAELPEERLLKLTVERGYRVSPEQVRRWRQAGLLLRPRQRGLGRGRGTETLYPAEALPQLFALCELLKQSRSLDRAFWRLWWSGYKVPMDGVRELLQGQIEWLNIQRRGLEQLDQMDSETFWEKFERVEKDLTKPRTHKMLRQIRRHMGKDRFVSFVVRILSVGTGMFDGWEPDDDPRLLVKGIGLDGLAEYRAIATNPKAAQEFENELRTVCGALDVEKLKSALDRATDESILATREELREAFGLIGKFRFLVVGILGSNNVINSILSTFAEMDLKDHLYLFLIWLSLRKSEGFRQAYQSVLAQIKAGLLPAADYMVSK